MLWAVPFFRPHHLHKSHQRKFQPRHKGPGRDAVPYVSFASLVVVGWVHGLIHAHAEVAAFGDIYADEAWFVRGESFK
jgi:hypothetical protein